MRDHPTSLTCAPRFTAAARREGHAEALSFIAGALRLARAVAHTAAEPRSSARVATSQFTEGRWLEAAADGLGPARMDGRGAVLSRPERLSAWCRQRQRPPGPALRRRPACVGTTPIHPAPRAFGIIVGSDANPRLRKSTGRR
jgi:hypothetical protein